MRTDEHEPTDACKAVHCWIHNVDEPDGEYGCGECGHAFSTLGDLMADWNRKAAEFGSDMRATNPGEVFSCPHCSHDF